MSLFASRTRSASIVALLLSALAHSAQAQGTPPKTAKPPALVPQRTGAPGEEENEMEDQVRRAQFRLLTLEGKDKKYDPNDLLKAKRHVARMARSAAAWPMQQPSAGRASFAPKAANIQPSGWTSLGPGNIGGRTRSIVTHPTDPNILYAGAVSGGVWKTVNAGASWQPLNDFMPSIAVTTLVMDPSNPNILYAGTGERFAGTGLRGAGVFKTTNAGVTWTQLASTATIDFHYVNRLAIHPTNPQILLAATWLGLHRSTDGGATWTNRRPARPNRSGEACEDVDFHPTDGVQAVATCYDFFDSTSQALWSADGGMTWTPAGGTPIPPCRRAEIAYSRSHPNIVYASSDNNQGELYRSLDGGHTYALRNSGSSYLSGQGWYNNALWVDPLDPNNLMLGGISMLLSRDAGQTLESVWSGDFHADQHVIVPAQNYSATNRRLYVGNDGGIYRTDDFLNLGIHPFASLNNDYAVTQFYGGNGHPTVNIVMGGTQDNGTPRYAGGRHAWLDGAGGDGGMVAVDPRVGAGGVITFYGEYQAGGLWRMSLTSAGDIIYHSTILPTGKGLALWVAPIVLDPNNPDWLYQGRQRLWRLDSPLQAPGIAWTPLSPEKIGNSISAIAVAKGNSDILWTGTSGGDIQYTTNGTSANPTWVDRNIPGKTGWYVTRLAIDPTNHDRVYATFGGFLANNVWRSENAGVTWTDITANLPDVPVRSLVIHPQNSNFLYIGTEAGVFASENRGGSWSPSNDGPTNASVDELFWVGNRLHAATHGRGMWSIAVNSPPTAALTAPTAGQSFPAGSNIDIAATASDADGTVSRVEFLQGTQVLGSDATSPYTFTWTGVPAGTYDLVARAVDSDGGFGNSAAVRITVGSAPSISLPGRIQAEDYKAGGPGVGFQDLTAGNSGGAYRTDAVDIEATTDVGGGFNVGWTEAGEWLAYDVNVTASGAYNLTARLASGAAPGSPARTLVMAVDGAPVATFTLTDFAGWQGWRDVTVNNVNLTAGAHQVRLTLQNGDFNVNYVDVTSRSGQAPAAHAGPDQEVEVNTQVTLDGRGSSDPDNGPSPLTYAWTQVSGPSVTLNNAASAQPTFHAGTVGTYVFRLVVSDGAANSAPDTVRVTAGSGIQYIELPGRIEAEAYRPGGPNVGYRDLTPGNTGGVHRAEDVDLEATTDAGGGFNVGWTEAGEWLAYDVRVATAGAYSLTARVASGSAGTKTLRMLVDGVPVADFTFTEASGWQAWRDVVVDNVSLTAGVHLVTLEMATGGINVNYVDVQPASNSELLQNGAFDNGLTGWVTQMTAPAAGAWGADAGSAKATITAPGEQPWQIQIAQQVSLTGGKVYTLEFDVKAEATPKPFKVVVEHNADPWTKYHEQQYTVTAAAGTFQHFKITFTQPVTDAAVRVGFHFGTFNESDVWLDNASLK